MGRLAPGVYHGTMNYNSTSDGFIDNASLIPYPPAPSPTSQSTAYPEPPIAVASTEFHFVLLYQDRVTAVSNLDERVTFDEILPLVRKSQRRRTGMKLMEIW